MQMDQVVVEPGVPIAFSLSGPADDRALLICHGLGASHLQWEQDARALSAERQVLTLDLRGHGESALVPNGTKADYTLEKMAADVIGVIEHCGLKQVDFLGNSLGGVVGLELIKQRRDLVRSLITCGTTYELRMPVMFVWLKKLMFKIKGNKLPDFIAERATSNEAARPLIRRMYREVSLPMTHLIDYNIHRYSYLEVARGFAGRIVILRGERDADINRALKSTLETLQGQPNFQLVELPGVGHFTNLDKPELFRDKLRAVLKDL